jgi:hypothetical protein
LTVHLLDLPDQVNTDLVKEGDKLDLQVKINNTGLVKEGGKLYQVKTKNTDLVKNRGTNFICR